MKKIIEKFESKVFMKNLVIIIASDVLILLLSLLFGYYLKRFLL